MGDKAVIEVQNNTHLEKYLTTDREMQKKLNKVIREVLKKARRRVSEDSKQVLRNDPRAAYKAVRLVLYKKIYGGNINILNSKRASATRVHVERASTRKSERGGNRCPRTKRTEQIDSYYGADRGFILRFVNAGTAVRTTRYGNRGSIAARNWFGSTSEAELRKATDEFTKLIDEVIMDMDKKQQQNG